MLSSYGGNFVKMPGRITLIYNVSNYHIAIYELFVSKLLINKDYELMTIINTENIIIVGTNNILV